MNALLVFGCFVGGILVLYVMARVLSAAIFRSWWDVAARYKRVKTKQEKEMDHDGQ